MNKKIFYGCLLIFLVTLIIRIMPASLMLLTSDACVYLDIARNISLGKGFYVSYNLCQFWKGPFYPAWVYMPPMLPIALSIVWKLFHSVYAAVLLNVFISGLNCIILYLILENIYKNTLVSFWATILVSICRPMFLTSINVWTEQLHLLFVLVAIFILLKNFPIRIRKLQSFIIGILLAFGFLTRAASMFNLLAILVFIFLNFGITKKSFQLVGYLLFGFAIIILPYQLLCILKFNAIYPQYLKINTSGYLKALLIGGHYNADHIPVLQANRATYDFIINYNFEMISLWMITTIKMIFDDFGILFYFLSLRLLFPFYNTGDIKIRTKESLLIILALTNFIGHTFTPYWHLGFSSKDAMRYSLVIYVLLIPIALKYFHNFLINSNIVPEILARKVYYIGLFFIFITLTRQALPYTDINLYSYYKEKKDLRKKAFSWITQNTNPSEITATSEIQEAFELFRPVVSLPDGKVLTKPNMKDYLSIYRPPYILISQNLLPKYNDTLMDFVDKVLVKEEWNRLYTIYKLKLPEGR